MRFFFLCFFAMPLPALAAGVEKETCLADCSLEGAPLQVACHCGLAPRWFRDWQAGQKNARVNIALRRRVPFLERTAIVRHDCDHGGDSALCRCIAKQTHFSLGMDCSQTRAGEKLCLLSRAAFHPQPQRAPGLADYEQCVAELREDQPATSCREARCAPSPHCDAGQGLVNVAAPRDCCPLFLCQPLAGRSP